MKDINLICGRFMPFTKGHQSVLEALYKENGYPTVVACIKNTKHDAKHPFDDELIAKEFDTCLNNEKFFEDHIYVTSAAIDKIGAALKEKGYLAHLWGCGTDRAKSFERMASNPKYIVDFADDFKVFVVERDENSNGIDGISATKVREAIKNDDKKEFERMMPKGAGKLFDEFKEQLSKVNESSSCNLCDYIENLNYMDIE